jgi:hypothetical protein
VKLRKALQLPAESDILVPKGGLEPPHPCEYMDLNHARLPIPPLRLGSNLAAHTLELINRQTSVFQTQHRMSIRPPTPDVDFYPPNSV